MIILIQLFNKSFYGCFQCKSFGYAGESRRVATEVSQLENLELKNLELLISFIALHFRPQTVNTSLLNLPF